uniref:Uncharacterized protein n=1 Tax=Soybean thrips tombus-like virus 4 TaxID=2802946 RepID=A0A7T8JIG9_9TOMB|nr:hypothetical protein 3 [Soybean thrips tombus-like virus 4]
MMRVELQLLDEIPSGSARIWLAFGVEFTSSQLIGSSAKNAVEVYGASFLGQPTLQWKFTRGAPNGLYGRVELFLYAYLDKFLSDKLSIQIILMAAEKALWLSKASGAISCNIYGVARRNVVRDDYDLRDLFGYDTDDDYDRCLDQGDDDFA